MPALNDLIAGHIQVLFADSPPVLPQINGGKVRALGVTTGKRIPAAPDIPTIRNRPGRRTARIASREMTACGSTPQAGPRADGRAVSAS